MEAISARESVTGTVKTCIHRTINDSSISNSVYQPYPNANVKPDSASKATIDEGEACGAENCNPCSHDHTGETQDGERAEVPLEFLSLAHAVHINSIGIGAGLDALAIVCWTVAAITNLLVHFIDFVLRIHGCSMALGEEEE